MLDMNQEEFDQWLEDLPRSRQLIAFQRGCIAVGYEHSLKDDGSGIVIDGNLQDPDFEQAVHEAFWRMYVDEIIQELLEEGSIEAVGVNDAGEVEYAKAVE